MGGLGIGGSSKDPAAWGLVGGWVFPTVRALQLLRPVQQLALGVAGLSSRGNDSSSIALDMLGLA